MIPPPIPGPPRIIGRLQAVNVSWGDDDNGPPPDPTAPPLLWSAISRPTTSDIDDRSIITGAQCRIGLPYDRIPPGLSGNARGRSWRPKAASTRMVRADVTNLARAVGLHRLSRPVRFVDVELVWAPGDHRRRDEDNLYGLVKVAADALARGPRKDWVGLDLVPDDTSAYMKKSCRILPPPEPKGMWLDLTLRFEEAA